MTARQDCAYICNECGAVRSGAVRRWDPDLKCAGDCGRATRHLPAGVRTARKLSPSRDRDWREDANRGIELYPGVNIKELDKLRTVVAGLNQVQQP